MMRAHRVLVFAGLLAFACDSKDAEEAEAGDQAGETGDGDGDEAVDDDTEGEGDGDGDGDGDAELDPTSCLAYTDVDQCEAAGCGWWPAKHITYEGQTCAIEQYPMCIPPASDGGDPACVFSIPGCPELVEGAEGPFQPAWIEHPDGGWVVIDLCGNLEYDSFTKCASGSGDAHPACNCACAT